MMSVGCLLTCATLASPAQILAEIMIHSSFKHPNVVTFEDAIEDDEHVYFKLELCKAGVSGRVCEMVSRRGVS